MKAFIDENKAQLESLKASGAPSMDERERLLKIRMLEAKIRVQESLYGMNLVKTVSLGGAAISGILNLLGIRLSKDSVPAQTKLEVSESGISVETTHAPRPVAGRVARKPKASKQAAPKEATATAHTDQALTIQSRVESEIWSFAADHAYALFGLVFILIFLWEFVAKRFAKKEES